MKKLALILSAILFLLCGCDSLSAILPSGKEMENVSASPSVSPGDLLSPSPTPSPSPSPTPEPTPVRTYELTEYTGSIYHVFYHVLIAYPEIARETSYWKNLEQDCVTPSEFWRSLEELYKNDYVLMNVNDYITVNSDGSITKNPLMVPVGKKPLVMSFDDVSYYSKNLGKGTCDKLILDDNGKFAMSTLQKDGSELITYDNCVVPLLEKFCAEYPDFSPFGDKGLLALTGYDGILGYRIQRDSPNRESEIEAVKPIVEELKKSGWTFGSHSYGHIHTRSVSLDKVKADTQNWLNEIAPVVGDTMVYVFPYGEYTEHSDAKFQYLLNQGFKIICGVGMPPYFRAYDTYVFMDRQNIDGYSLRNSPKWLEPLMDRDYVYSKDERDAPLN